MNTIETDADEAEAVAAFGAVWPEAKMVPQDAYFPIARRHPAGDGRHLSVDWDWIPRPVEADCALLLRRNSPLDGRVLFEIQWHGASHSRTVLAACHNEVARWGDVIQVGLLNRAPVGNEFRGFVIVESRLEDWYLDARSNDVVWIRDRNIKVVEVARRWLAAGSVEEVRLEDLYDEAHGDPTLPELYAAASYYWRHTEEIKAEMELRDRRSEELRKVLRTAAPSRAALAGRSED